MAFTDCEERSKLNDPERQRKTSWARCGRGQAATDSTAMPCDLPAAKIGGRQKGFAAVPSIRVDFTASEKVMSERTRGALPRRYDPRRHGG